MTEAGRVVVLAVGNPSRGDDAIGPLLCDRISAGFPEVVAIPDFQLQVEHALDLRAAGLVLFIDAAVGFDEPVRFGEIGPGRSSVPFSHAVGPHAVLEVFRQVEGRAPPPAFVLAVRGRSFELGEPLSVEAFEALERGWELLRSLLASPRVAHWRGVARAGWLDQPLATSGKSSVR